MKPTDRKLKLTLADLQVSSFEVPSHPGDGGTVRALSGDPALCIPDIKLPPIDFPETEVCAPRSLNISGCCTQGTGFCCFPEAN